MSCSAVVPLAKPLAQSMTNSLATRRSTIYPSIRMATATRQQPILNYSHLHIGNFYQLYASGLQVSH